MDIKVIIAVSAVGIAALFIVLGWLERLGGYAFNNPDMISRGTGMIIVGAILYVLEFFIYIFLYLKSEGHLD